MLCIRDCEFFTSTLKKLGVGVGVLHHTACGILVPWPRIELMLPALEVLSLSTGPSEKFPGVYLPNCIWLFCDPIDCCPPGYSAHGISQWVAISFWVEVKELLNILQWVGQPLCVRALLSPQCMEVEKLYYRGKAWLSKWSPTWSSPTQATLQHSTTIKTLNDLIHYLSKV